MCVFNLISLTKEKSEQYDLAHINIHYNIYMYLFAFLFFSFYYNRFKLNKM